MFLSRRGFVILPKVCGLGFCGVRNRNVFPHNLNGAFGNVCDAAEVFAVGAVDNDAASARYVADNRVAVFRPAALCRRRQKVCRVPDADFNGDAAFGVLQPENRLLPEVLRRHPRRFLRRPVQVWVPALQAVSLRTSAPLLRVLRTDCSN